MLTNCPKFVEINLDNLIYNINKIKIALPNNKIMAMLKANAYNHGAIEVAKVLESIGIDIFGVACLNEAKELIANGIKGKIVILSPLLPENLVEAVNLGCSITLASKYDIDSIRGKGIYPNVHIKVDTGMGRFGFDVDEVLESINAIRSENLCNVEGLFSHLSSAISDIEYTKKQIGKFTKIVKNVTNIPFRHIAASSSFLVREHYGDIFENSLFNMVRIGGALYGVSPNSSIDMSEYRNVLSIKGRVVSIAKMKEDSYISYDKTYLAEKGSTVAGIALGYSDGVCRELSNKGYVLINGIKCNIIGIVCMNVTLVEAPENANVKIGDLATIVGNDIRIEELSKLSGEKTYKFLMNVGKMIPKIYIKNEQIDKIENLF